MKLQIHSTLLYSFCVAPIRGFVALLLLIGFPDGTAQEVIRAKDYSGFMRGNGYGWQGPVASDPGPLNYAASEGEIILTWPSNEVLQSAAVVTGPWTDEDEALSPCFIAPTEAQAFYRLRHQDALHDGVGSGCPQQGFKYTGLPGAESIDPHWANHAASRDGCGWIVPQALTGFANEPSNRPPYFPIDFVRVVMRVFHGNPAPPNNWTWWEGSILEVWDDNAEHQNEGWFHFRVRNPDPLGPQREYRLRFEIDWDNPYGQYPPDGPPVQLNTWWAGGYAWDWEDHDGRHIFTPIYRIKYLDGSVGNWRHISEANVHPTAEAAHDDGRHYRCLFEQVIPNGPWREVEVAQNIPYTFNDRERFFNFIQANYPIGHFDLGIRKVHLGYGGLATATNLPPSQIESNELYAIEIFRTGLGSQGTPSPPNNKIVVFMAGLDYEPAGNWVAEGVALEILDNWRTAGKDYRNLASYVIIPIANPDAYEWGMCHVVPYGNGYDDNTIHRGYMFLENDSVVPDSVLDPEMRNLRNYIRRLTADGLDGRGGRIVTFLNFENDLCPHPSRWLGSGGWDVFPPVYGTVQHSDLVSSNAGFQFVQTLTNEVKSPFIGRYTRGFVANKGWRVMDYDEYDIELRLNFEFDAAVLYAQVPDAASWVQGQFDNPVQLPGATGVPHFYAQGYLDQIGQRIADDPAYVFKQFGRDITDAVREEVLIASP